MENQKNQACGEEALLLWYAAGALSQEESEQVARHLALCARCRQEVGESQELAQLYRSLPHLEEVHSSAEELVRLAQSGLETTGPAAIRQHLAACAECSQLLSVVQKVNRDLAASTLSEKWGPLVARLRAGWIAFERGFSPWVRSPVPAYLLALLLVFPAYLGLFGVGALRERMNRLETPTLLGSPHALETAAERGGGSARLRLDRSGGRAVLTFFVPIAAERYRYQVELKGPRGETIFFEPDARSFDGVGTFALLLAEGALESGAYKLVVEERERDGGGVKSVFSFPFSMERR